MPTSAVVSAAPHLYVSRLAIPDYGHAVRGEVIALPSAKVVRLVPHGPVSTPPLQRRGHGQKPVKAGGCHGLDVPCLSHRAVQGKGHYRLVRSNRKPLELGSGPASTVAEVLFLRHTNLGMTTRSVLSRTLGLRPVAPDSLHPPNGLGSDTI